MTIPLSSFFMNSILLRVSNKSGSQGLIFSCVWDFLSVDLCSWQPLCRNYLKSEVEVWSSKEGVSFLQPSAGAPIDWRPPQAKCSPECGESITHGKNGLKHQGTGCFWFAMLMVLLSAETDPIKHASHTCFDGFVPTCGFKWQPLTSPITLSVDE